MANQSPGEQEARESLRQSVARNRTQVELAEETMLLIRREIHDSFKRNMENTMSQANIEKFWLVGMSLLQKQADQKTGTFVRGVAIAIVRKGALFIVLGGIVYAVGGWTALASLIKALIKD